MLRKKVVYVLQGTDDVTVESAVYHKLNGEDLIIDIYHPHDKKQASPAIVYVSGYPDGTPKLVVPSIRESNAYKSWARLTAASGLTSILYSTREPLKDIYRVFEYIRDKSESLRIDIDSIGIWVCSANTPTAQTFLMDKTVDYIKCAAMYYGLMLDWDDNLGINKLAEQIGFSYPENVKKFNNFPDNIPIFMVRAGIDDVPNCNTTQDRFVAKALERNLPLTLINYQNGRHGFDLQDDNDESRKIIGQTIAFLIRHLMKRTSESPY